MVLKHMMLHRLARFLRMGLLLPLPGAAAQMGLPVGLRRIVVLVAQIAVQTAMRMTLLLSDLMLLVSAALVLLARR